jgi:hypothetical protein
MFKIIITTFFVLLTLAIGCYFFLAYRLDTIIVYDREEAYTNVGNHLSIKPEFMINSDKELRVFLNFENVHEVIHIKSLDVTVSSSSLMSVTSNLCDTNPLVPTFFELPENCKLVHPGYESSSGSITFAFDSRMAGNSYLVTVKGTILSSPNQPPTTFTKQLTIRKKTVVSERSWLF